jgi:hypothetical protein
VAYLIIFILKNGRKPLKSQIFHFLKKNHQVAKISPEKTPITNLGDYYNI